VGRERAKEELKGWNDITQESFGVAETHRVSTQITILMYSFYFHHVRMFTRFPSASVRFLKNDGILPL